MSFDFEIKAKTKIKVGIYDKEYEIFKPTVKQAEFFAKEAGSLDDKDKLAKTVEFMSLMGLPKDVSENMEIEHFAQLVEFIVGKVKKN